MSGQFWHFSTRNGRPSLLPTGILVAEKQCRKTSTAAALALAVTFAGELDERQLTHQSEQYYEAGERLKAIAILEIVVASFPESWFPISIMADLQIEGGDTTVAIVNYKKSLALNPDNRWATDRLKELGE